MLMDPQSRSSVAPKGSVTTRATSSVNFSLFPASRFNRQSSQNPPSSFGSQPAIQSITRFCAGSSAARDRTTVDLAVPRCPIISTPPILGSMRFRISASFISSCPTMAENGNSADVAILAPLRFETDFIFAAPLFITALRINLVFSDLCQILLTAVGDLLKSILLKVAGKETETRHSCRRLLSIDYTGRGNTTEGMV